MNTPTKRPTLPEPNAPKRQRSEIDMFHLVESMSADNIPVTTPTKPPTMPEPNAPKRPCSTAVRRVGKKPPPFDPDKLFACA